MIIPACPVSSQTCVSTNMGNGHGKPGYSWNENISFPDAACSPQKTDSESNNGIEFIDDFGLKRDNMLASSSKCSTNNNY